MTRFRASRPDLRQSCFAVNPTFPVKAVDGVMASIPIEKALSQYGDVIVVS